MFEHNNIIIYLAVVEQCIHRYAICVCIYITRVLRGTNHRIRLTDVFYEIKKIIISTYVCTALQHN